MSYILDALKKSERERNASLERAAASSPASAVRPTLSPWVCVAAGIITAVVVISAFGIWWPAPPAGNTATPSTTGAVRDLAEQARVPAPRAASVAPAKPASPPVAAEVPFLRSLPDELRRSLPEMTVNIHVYTPDESRRLLYINNREYHKGDYLSGVLIEDVLPDGVLVNYHGVRFKLERPR
jgi:general secretion pathway protein B